MNNFQIFRNERIAVIISTTRKRSLLDVAIPSVLNQSRPPDYVYIVADSYDHLPSEEIKARNTGNLIIKFILNQREMNLSGAMNSVFMAMLDDGCDPENTFIAILDDDDSWERDYLESCYNMASKSDLDWVVSGIIRHESNFDSGKLLTIPEIVDEKSLLRGNPHIQGSNFFIRFSKVLLAGGYDENLPSTTDRDLALRLIALGNVKIGILKHHLVHHNAYGEGRLSDKGSDKKFLGLKRFYYKYRHFMDAEDQTSFLERAKTLFGCDLELHQEDVNEVRVVSGISKGFSHNIEIVIGVILSEVRYLDNLIKDAVKLTKATGCVASLVVLNNSGKPLNQESGISDELAKSGTNLTVVEMDKAEQSADKGDLGLFYRDKRNRKGIAFGRTALHRFVYLESLKYSDPVVWIIDDDVSIGDFYWGTLDNKISEHELMWHIARWKESGVGIVVGKVGGDPPTPIMSTSRTQLLDLYYNLRAILETTRNGSRIELPCNIYNATKSLQAYFYDFPDKSFRHLETPIWDRPHANDLKFFCRDAKNILRNGIFRQASYPPNGDNYGELRFGPETEEFGPVRGGNTIILDIDCLRDFTNSSPRSGDISYRRGDTLWVIMNKRLGPRRPIRHSRDVLSSPFMLIQNRLKYESPLEMRTKLVADALGSAFVRSIDMLLLQKNLKNKIREDFYGPLNWTDSEIKELVGSVEREIHKRKLQMSLNFWRIRGLIQSTRSVLEHFTNFISNNVPNYLEDLEEISELCIRMDSLFSEEELNKILKDLTYFSKGDLLEFIHSLGESCRQFSDALPIRYSKKDLDGLRTKIMRTFNAKELKLIGTGKEGIVFSDTFHSYKYFHYGSYALEKSKLRFLSEKVLGKKFSTIARLKSISLADNEILFKEELVNGTQYEGGETKGLVSLIQEMRENCIVIKNIAPKNLILTRNVLKFVDLGRDLEPYSPEGYMKMCKRAYLTYRWHFRNDIQELFRLSNTGAEFPELYGFQYFLDLIDDKYTGELSVPFVSGQFSSVHGARILDYGCGTGEIADKLAESNSVSVYDKDMSNYLRKHPSGGSSIVLSDGDLNKISAGTDRFDIVLLSLVLCTVGDMEVREILSKVRRLLKDKGELFVVICNPFNVHNRETGTHVKLGPLKNYHGRFKFEKKMKITNSLRCDYHRPLEWYFNELRRSGFEPLKYAESVGASFDTVSPGSEFLMIRADSGEIPKEYDVSLMIKASAMEWRSIGFQVRHIVRQLERCEKFKEKFIVTDQANDNFARQYDDANLVMFKRELKKLQEDGIIDFVYFAPKDISTINAVSERWFATKCAKPKSMNGQPVITTLQGLEMASAKYILQMDSDCIICRDETGDSYLKEMIDVVEKRKDAISVSFPVYNQPKKPFAPSNNSIKWRTEVRNCLIHKERLFSLRPFPNSIDEEGNLKFPWHRSLDIKLATGPWESLRGSLGNAFFIHVPNTLKIDLNFWYNAGKYHENYPVHDDQKGNVDLQATNIKDFLEPRDEELIILVKGKNVPIPKIRRCFHSLLEQNFLDFSVIYVDAGSENGADEYVRYLGKSLFQGRITIFKNYIPLTSIENIWIAIKVICTNPNSIIAMVDADDALIGKNALSKVRTIYRKGADLTVGTMLRTDKYKMYPVDFENPRLNRGGNVWQHLRTFKKYLFDSIREDDLKINGKWIEQADDWAFMIPMVELAERPQLIKDQIYFYEPSPEKKTRDSRSYEETIGMIVSKKSYRNLVAR